MLVNRMNIFESDLGSVDQGHMLSIDSLAMSFNHMRASVGVFQQMICGSKRIPGFPGVLHPFQRSRTWSLPCLKNPNTRFQYMEIHGKVIPK